MSNLETIRNTLIEAGNFFNVESEHLHLRKNFLTERHRTPVFVRRHLDVAKWFPDLLGLSELFEKKKKKKLKIVHL